MKDLFEETGIKITTGGHEILGAACGNRSFVEEYVAHKVDEWVEEIELLSKIAEMYPHAYNAFSRVIMGKRQYLMRTIGSIDEMFQPLEIPISAKFIPALTGRGHFSSAERTILSLPTRHGGLNLVHLTEVATVKTINF